MGAWYHANKTNFLKTDTESILGKLCDSSARNNMAPEADQITEWRRSIELLKKVLKDKSMSEIDSVILEYDFKRRGLRIDCILTAPGAIFVLEFKRNNIDSTARDQIMNYCVNLIEFHDETQKVVKKDVIVIPILSTTEGKTGSVLNHKVFSDSPWESLLKKPLESDKSSLQQAIESALKLRKIKTKKINLNNWVNSPFKPSSTMLDAVISLFGQHDVSAIEKHGAAVEAIEKCTEEIKQMILDVRKKNQKRKNKKNRLIFLSGVPGAGKTLVGMKLIFDSELRDDSVYVTGNAPLVDVLNEALQRSYHKKRKGNSLVIPSGYAKDNARKLVENATFKITKVHHFLPKERGTKLSSKDGSTLIFDEAQRTFEQGHQVQRQPLPDHEANLILESMAKTYPNGAVVVVLIGHNQAINLGERGMVAWFEAAEKEKWEYAISDETLDLPNAFKLGSEKEKWKTSSLRMKLNNGHLRNSMRHYRNEKIEKWVGEVLEGETPSAKKIASSLKKDDTVYITRDLEAAKQWIRKKCVGNFRSGLLASSQANRLIADGVHVTQQSERIHVHWMLSPNGDIRSSNMLEKAVTQFQIQGLEIDFSLVCWDADLRREGTEWVCFDVSGAKWIQKKSKKEDHINIRKNIYRVLLTRARKGMVIFVPEGDKTGQDKTRDTRFYDDIFNHLVSCGATKLP